MATRRMALVCVVVALFLGHAASVVAQKKPKPPASYPGTAIFRCNGLSSSSCLASPTSDRMIGDSTVYQGLGAPEGGEGAHLRSNVGDTNGEMWVGIRNSLRVYLDFVSQDLTAPCRTGGNNYCQYPGAFPSNAIVIGATYSEIQSSVVKPGDEANKAVTLLDVPLGDTWDARIFVSFNDSSGRLWNFSFSDTRSNGEPSLGRNARVTRVGACHWIFSDSDDGDGAAELSTLVRVSGRQFRSFEGVYTAPFEIDFDATGCPGTLPTP